MKHQPDKEIDRMRVLNKELLLLWSWGPGMVVWKSVLVTPSGSPMNTYLLFGFLIEVSLHRHGNGFDFLLLSPPPKSCDVVKSSNPLLQVGSPGNQPIFGAENSNSPFTVGSLGNQAHLRCFPQVTFININPVVVERNLLWIMRHPVHNYGSEVISGTKEGTKYCNRRCSYCSSEWPHSIYVYISYKWEYYTCNVHGKKTSAHT